MADTAIVLTIHAEDVMRYQLIQKRLDEAYDRKDVEQYRADRDSLTFVVTTYRPDLLANIA